METTSVRKIPGAIRAAVIAALAAALAPSAASAKPCAATITACGCTISAPGSYTLSGAGPIASAGTCIDIAAGNVTLSGAPTVIAGPGAMTSTFGVHIEPAANKAVVSFVTVEDFGQGIRVDGPNATLGDDQTEANGKGMVINGAHAYVLAVISDADEVAGLQVNGSAADFVAWNVVAEHTARGAGITLNAANGAFFDDAQAADNATFGIWLSSASNNHFDGFVSTDNQIAGVYLGCNPTGPNLTRCPAGVPSSNGNTFIGSIYASKASSVNSTGIQQLGVAVGLGNLHNHFAEITGDGNVADDARDENSQCGSNRWIANTFTRTSPANLTAFCLH